jgi:hypothetical protein
MKKFLFFLCFFALTAMQIWAGGPHGIESDTIWYREFSNEVRQVKFSPDGNLIYAAVNNNKPLLIDAVTSNTIKQFDSLFSPIVIDLTADGKTFCAINNDSLVVWDTQTGAIFKKISPPKETWTNVNYPPQFKTMSISPDGSYLSATVYFWTSTSSHGDPIFTTRLYTWDTHTWQIFNQMDLSFFNKIIYSHNGNYLACGGLEYNNSATITVFDAKKWQVYTTFTGHAYSIADLSFSPDDSFLASCIENINIWDMKNKKLYKQIYLNHRVTSVNMFSNSTLLYCDADNNGNGLWLNIYDINISQIKNLIKSDYIFSININMNKDIVLGAGYSLVLLNENQYLTYIDENQIYNNINFEPNPIDSYAYISYSNIKSSNVAIDIYDISSKKVDNIYNGNLDSGKHTIPWHPNNLPDGVYFCRVLTKDNSIFSKLIIAK